MSKPKLQTICKVIVYQCALRYDGCCYKASESACPRIVVMMYLKDAHWYEQNYMGRILPEGDATPLTEKGTCG